MNENDNDNRMFKKTFLFSTPSSEELVCFTISMKTHKINTLKQEK